MSVSLKNSQNNKIYQFSEDGAAMLMANNPAKWTRAEELPKVGKPKKVKEVTLDANDVTE